MDKLLEELQIAIKAELHIVALNIALTIPDICAALQDPDGQTTGTKYAAWWDNYVTSYNRNITGQDAYKIRCAVLHQGKLDNDRDPRYKKILFQIPDKGGQYILDNNVINDGLQINLITFINCILSAFYEWQKSNKGNSVIIDNSRYFISYHPDGYPPYINGIPVIA